MSGKVGVHIGIAGCVLGFLLFICITGCGGGGVTAAAPDGISPPALADLVSAPASPTSDPVFAVRMQPQQPQALPAKGVSWAAPLELNRLLPVPDKLVSADEALRKDASSYEQLLPQRNVIVGAPPNAIFSPTWDPVTPDNSGLAFAMYRFSLTSYEVLPVETLGYSWEAAPTDYANLWIGLGNTENNSWDWYLGDPDSAITIEDTGQYIDDVSHNLLLAVVVLGSDECVLTELRLGVHELRGTGGMAAIPDDDDAPPLYSGILGSSIDLSLDCAPVNDQGVTGACTAFAVTDAAYNYELSKIYGDYGGVFTDPINLTSPRYLYVETGADQGLDCPYAGRYTDGVLSWLVSNGVATEANAPFGNPPEPDWCSRDWSQAALDDAVLLESESYGSFDPTGSTGVADIKTILYQQQRLVIMQTGLDWDFMAYAPGSVWNYGGPVVGYHAMCIVGYDDSLDGGNGAFKVRNSWSDQWGDAGYCWIGYDTFINAAAGQYLWCWTIEGEYHAPVAEQYCSSAPLLEPPTNLQASDGEYAGLIRLSWASSPDATGYEVYRDSQDNLLATLGDLNQWDDTTVTDQLGHIYWLKATAGALESNYCTPDVGYLAQPPEIDGVTQTSGEPGANVTFSASVSGSSPMSFSWDFGGGATPNVSDSSSPQVILGAAGDYSASLTVTNSFGFDLYEFTLSIGGMPVEFMTIPHPQQIISSNDYLWLFYPEPIIRRSPRGYFDLLTEEFVPESEAAFNDILKTSGNEFTVEYVAGALYPKAILRHDLTGSSDPSTILVTDPQAGGVVQAYTCPGYIVMDILVLTTVGLPGDPPEDYDYRVFTASAPLGEGEFQVIKAPTVPFAPTGIDWGLNIFSRSDGLLADRNYTNHTLDGTSIGSATPDVLFVEFSGGQVGDWDDPLSIADNTQLILTGITGDTVMSWDPRVAVNSEGSSIVMHVFTPLDYHSPTIPGWPGHLEPGNLYNLQLADTAGIVQYTFTGQLVVIGPNPND